ncbi:hypothetical protein A2U01_0041409, partial [Trifolium medium]|nr:hypothetical protein [Trifolium medium]
MNIIYGAVKFQDFGVYDRISIQ